MLKKDAIYQKLRRTIESGELAAGTALPGEEKLAQLHGVSRVTLRSALSRLESGGFVTRVDSKGTFVSDRFRAELYLIIVSDGGHPASPAPFLLAGLENSLREAGCSVEICSANFLAGQKKETLLENFSRFAGIFSLSASWSGTEVLLEALNAFPKPVVYLSSSLQDQRVVTNGALLYLDCRKAFREALEYLHRLGHRHVAIFSAMKDVWDVRGYDREQYQELLRQTGLDDSEELWHFFPLTQESAEEHLRTLLARNPEVTAVMCYSDYWAFSVISALNSMGIPVPGRLSVMGFSAFPGGQFTTPSLSSIDFGLQERGRKAVRLMLDSSAWFSPGRVHIEEIPYSLIIRQSTGKI